MCVCVCVCVCVCAKFFFVVDPKREKKGNISK